MSNIDVISTDTDIWRPKESVQEFDINLCDISKMLTNYTFI